MSIRPSPRQRILELVIERPEGIGRPFVRDVLEITYSAATWWLERLVREGLIRKEWKYKRIDKLYWWWSYYPVPPVPPKLELIQATIAIYSLTDSPTPRPYKCRFQGFFTVDALRDSGTGEFRYDTGLARMEIDKCLDEFRDRWNWLPVGDPAKFTSEPLWIETSEFEFVSEPKGAILMSLSKLEDDEEVYWKRFYETIYYISEDEREEMRKYARSTD